MLPLWLTAAAAKAIPWCVPEECIEKACVWFWRLLDFIADSGGMWN